MTHKPNTKDYQNQEQTEEQKEEFRNMMRQECGLPREFYEANKDRFKNKSKEWWLETHGVDYE